MPSLADLRQEYSLAGLHENDLAPNPFQQFDQWFREAIAAKVVEPNAMSVATASTDGAPSVRTCLLKEMDEQGFVFFTNYESRKGRELATNPHAALMFPWIALERQVVVEGTVERVSRKDSETYFHSRPIGSQFGAWASAQSTVISGREELETNLEHARQRYADQTVPLPSYWGGYRVIPAVVEFWQGRPSRLHDRIRYRRDAENWVIERLSP